MIAIFTHQAAATSDTVRSQTLSLGHREVRALKFRIGLRLSSESSNLASHGRELAATQLSGGDSCSSLQRNHGSDKLDGSPIRR